LKPIGLRTSLRSLVNQSVYQEF